MVSRTSSASSESSQRTVSDAENRHRHFARLYECMSRLYRTEIKDHQQTTALIDELMNELKQARAIFGPINKQLESEILQLCLRKLEQGR
ncbi:hypothetical protein PMAYCL1PPCAC_05427 [Pristionchus mayeri]|uniref:Uncharacterized protein n=1 Tax=Pristionchus mayeri TaxID=1317129 RepID=A0AAN4ZCH3_9BILA|nr:hypothetical protein PMAYCL1PPCAC_05427 [Pristionchus mayeri]